MVVAVDAIVGVMLRL